MAERKKSIYKPRFPKKYKGDISNIICRSSWENKFCSWCDLNENILEWGSEEFFIPYRAPDGKVRRYYPDFIIKVPSSVALISSTADLPKILSPKDSITSPPSITALVSNPFEVPQSTSVTIQS